MTRVAVIVHERLGNWNRQLRPRLNNWPIRWFETRSRADLESLLVGLGSPIVLIDLGRYPAAGLRDLDHVLHRVSDARVLVLDPLAHDGVAALARELGATHVASGFVPPPFVASLLARWIELAARQIERNGWCKTSYPETDAEPWAWLADFLGDSQGLYTRPAPTPRGSIGPSVGTDVLPRGITTDR